MRWVSATMRACRPGFSGIEFSSLSRTAEKARNNVVHELGHAFDILVSRLPSGSLGDYQLQHSDFPNRSDFPNPVPKYWVGDYSGFASRMNVFTWQQSYALAGSAIEEFADQFLGWIYDKWETDEDGAITDDGEARSDFMKKYMPGWINTAAGR